MSDRKNADFAPKYGIIKRLATLRSSHLPRTEHAGRPSFQDAFAMTLSAPAKINLGLRILRKRADGFHDLETVFLRIGWADTLTLAPAQHTTMTCSDPSLPVDESNLCLRAVRAVQQAMPDGSHTGLRVDLQKNLPFGAGLGGGSSDAASCLMAANTMLAAGLSDQRLHELAASLGSDVPFFLMESGVALGTDRGTMLSPMAFPKALRGTWLVVAVPPVHVSTAEAYAGIRPDDGQEGMLEALVSGGSLAEWTKGLANDFESHLFDAHPGLAALKSDLLDAGARYAAMSGSGSAVFGVFQTEDEARSAAGGLATTIRTWVGPSDAGTRG